MIPDNVRQAIEQILHTHHAFPGSWAYDELEEWFYSQPTMPQAPWDYTFVGYWDEPEPDEEDFTELFSVQLYGADAGDVATIDDGRYSVEHVLEASGYELILQRRPEVAA